MGLLDGIDRQDYYSGNEHGNYQFVSLEDIINQFMIAYVGEGKIIPKTKKTDVAFHAQRALAELSFDTFKSRKSHEMVVPPSLQIPLPIDYVNHVKFSWIDSAGIKHILYPDSNTGDPLFLPHQDEDGKYILRPIATTTLGSNVIVLDGDYGALLYHGLRVRGVGIQNILPSSFISGVTTVAGITSITLHNQAATAVANATATTNSQVEITGWSRFGVQGAVPNTGNTLITTTTTAASILGDNQLTLSSTAGIEIGMYVNHIAFVNNTAGGDTAFKVTGVGTTTVDVEKPNGGGINNTVTTVAIGDSISFIKQNDDSVTMKNYKSGTSSENQDDYQDDTYWPMDGSRFGLDPQHAQANGFYNIAPNGKVFFSSNISGKTVVLDYISDSLGSNLEMQCHKLAEEAMYKHIVYAIMSTRANVPEYQVARFKKERFAETRKAKLRLSNIKLGEITQILRGKSKQIKH